MLLGAGPQQPDPLGGQRPGAPDSFPQGHQGVPDLARGGCPGGHRGQLRLQRLLTLLALGMGTTHRGKADPQCLLVPDVGCQITTGYDDVVSKQPQAGITQRRLNDAGFAGDFRLPAQRAQLAAQLGGQIGEPGEVGRHRLQLAQRLFLALAMLENAGRLLDKGTAVLRAGVQDRVELPLPDDDVELAADPGIAHELLDVQEPAGTAIDRVFALAAAEHQATDGHFAVVDRQGTVGVVNGQQHLRATQRRTRRGTRENDVGHGAAAQRLGSLFAENPCHGVDDVALARAVRPDHAGDTGLEVQSRRTRERLETPQGEALEVHRSPELSQGTGRG